jgi:hypothetical protein
MDGQPLGWGQRLTIRVGVREHATIIFRVTAGDFGQLAGAAQLLEGVEAGRIQ